jgi:hypothetical protein
VKRSTLAIDFVQAYPVNLLKLAKDAAQRLSVQRIHALESLHILRASGYYILTCGAAYGGRVSARDAPGLGCLTTTAEQWTLDTSQARHPGMGLQDHLVRQRHMAAGSSR